MNCNHLARPLSRLAGVALVLAVAGSPARAQDCTLIVDARSGERVLESGSCDTRYSPASTFKVPLALIGYDAGILTGAHTPLWVWRPGVTAPVRDQKPVDPTIWLAESVVWYSREITQRLGAARFADYVTRLGYGNMDVTGDPGARNGLTRSWIGSSLTISPREQTAFLRTLLATRLAVSPDAQRATMAIVPTFQTKSGWLVHGKTGSTALNSAEGALRKGQLLGWFVGWAEREGRVVVFARLGVGSAEGRQGLTERTTMLGTFEGL